MPKRKKVAATKNDTTAIAKSANGAIEVPTDDQQSLDAHMQKIEQEIRFLVGMYGELAKNTTYITDGYLEVYEGIKKMLSIQWLRLGTLTRMKNNEPITLKEHTRLLTAKLGLFSNKALNNYPKVIPDAKEEPTASVDLRPYPAMRG